jgi:hypothetical protein
VTRILIVAGAGATIGETCNSIVGRATSGDPAHSMAANTSAPILIDLSA